MLTVLKRGIFIPNHQLGGSAQPTEEEEKGKEVFDSYRSDGEGDALLSTASVPPPRPSRFPTFWVNISYFSLLIPLSASPSLARTAVAGRE